MITIELDWPSRKLSPNSRLSWQAKLSTKQREGESAYYAAMERRGEDLTKKQLEARLTFHPPSKRRRDLDNCLSAEKCRMDAICRALGIDDSQIRRVILEWGEVTKGGRVVVQIGAMEN